MLLTLFLQAPVPPVPVPVPINDWVIAAIVAFTPVVVAILDWVVSNFGSKMPSWLKPIVAIGLGALASSLAGIVTANPIVAALVGLAAIGLREIVSQLSKVTGLKAQ
jgi:hypothetical protein